MTGLLEPISVRTMRFANRAWVAPMSQYSVRYGDGMPTDWHLIHYGAFAQGGFGLILTEAMAVNPVGRVTLQDVGLWSDLQVSGWRKLTDFVHGQRLTCSDGSKTPVRIGVQLSHSGRKGSSRRPFPGEDSMAYEHGNIGWTTMGPSPIPYPGYTSPHELTTDEITRIIADFVAAAKRADRAGFDVLEINAAHGYLLHSFYSPLSNHRNDSYGGSFSNRVRLVREVTSAVRHVWHGPLFVRIAATDWTLGGWDSNDAVSLAVLLRMDGADLIDVSSGGNALTDVPAQPGYQMPFSKQIRQFAGVQTACGGLITSPKDASEFVKSEQTDAVLLGRVALREPHWPQRAAHELNVPLKYAPYQPQDLRGAWPLD
jgi:2,4-dienoyl-CoA reductase-like NADH-dependent reductase (Old Yellow Enzyme family)